jgi:IS30 family transposase
MGHQYEQLSLEERCEIARLQANGSSIRQIATALDRAPSTISREIKRNRGRQIGYKPSYAQEQTKARRWTGSRLERETGLRQAVLKRLARGWSPEQVAGRLAREAGQKVISYESIYRFIYAQIARHKEYRWRRYLPRGKSKRGLRGRRGGSSAIFIDGRVALSERPSAAADRGSPGHWEADLMLFSKYGQAVLTVHDRHSRLLLATRPPNKAADPIARHLLALLRPLPPRLRQTITFDNGTEFARHRALHRLGIKTFFCDPYAPWQKGGIENAIGRMRRFIPRKTDLAILQAKRFNALVCAYNNTPRKCLDFKTPAEIFAEVLRFECESTRELARGRADQSSRAARFCFCAGCCRGSGASAFALRASADKSAPMLTLRCSMRWSPPAPSVPAGPLERDRPPRGAYPYIFLGGG